MASSAIPISVAGLINLKEPSDANSYRWWFWTYNELGWICMGIALAAGYWCISAAPSWVIDQYTRHRFILVTTYWVAPIAFVLGLICFGRAAMIAIRYGLPMTHQ
jgi:hypothetical protein